MQFWNIARKDLRIISRDRTALIFTFGLPLVMTFIFGSIPQGGSSGSSSSTLRFAAQNQDRGAQGASLLDQLRKLGVHVDSASSPSDVTRLVRKGTIAAGIVIPPDFTARLEGSIQSGSTVNRAHVTVIIDPASSMLQGAATGIIKGAMKRVVALIQFPGAAAAMNDTSSTDPFTLDVSNEKQPQPSAGDIFIPGFLVYFVFFLANGVAATLLYERQEGTLRRMLSAPVSRFQILFGKLFARGVLGFIQTFLLLLIGIFWMHLTVTSAPVGLFVAVCVTVFCACGMGVLIATFGTTMEQIQGMTTMVLLLLGFISGTLIPRSILPASLVRISYFTPHAWALNAYQDLILRHTGLMGTWSNIVIVFAFGVGFFVIALARFRFE